MNLLETKSNIFTFAAFYRSITRTRKKLGSDNKRQVIFLLIILYKNQSVICREKVVLRDRRSKIWQQSCFRNLAKG